MQPDCKTPQLRSKKRSDNEQGSDSSPLTSSRTSSLLPSPHITPTSLPLQTAISGLPVSAVLPVCISSLSLLCGCVSSLLSERHTNRWRVTVRGHEPYCDTRHSLLLCPRPDGTDGSLTQSRAEQTRGQPPSLHPHTHYTNDHRSLEEIQYFTTSVGNIFTIHLAGQFKI